MRGKWVVAGFLATAALAYALPARAGDTMRLNQVQDVPAQRLVDDGTAADTIPVWHHGFGWGGGWGYRGFGGYGLGYRGLGWGGYGMGYRGFGMGYGMGYRGFGYGLGGYGLGLGYGLGYRGFGYGLGYRGFGYGLGGFGYGLGGMGYGLGGFGYPGFGLWGCSGTTGSTVTLGITGPATLQAAPLASAPLEAAPLVPAPAEETYPYDGGPAAPSMQPPVAPEQANQPTAPPQAKERAISLPKKAKKLAYPAYGEKQVRKSSSSSTLLTRDH